MRQRPRAAQLAKASACRSSERECGHSASLHVSMRDRQFELVERERNFERVGLGRREVGEDTDIAGNNRGREKLALSCTGAARIFWLSTLLSMGPRRRRPGIVTTSEGGGGAGISAACDWWAQSAAAGGGGKRGSRPRAFIEGPPHASKEKGTW